MISNINKQIKQNFFSNQRLLFLLAIIVIGFNLRPAITSVGPLLGTIRDQIGLTNWGAGTITSLPLIAFAAVSPLAPKIGRRLGNMPTILLGLSLLAVGIGVRSIPFTATLFIGTAVIGVGIAIMNVLLPAVIKEKFPNKIGRMTSVYSTSMSIFAATATGLSVPLAENAGLGWELSLLSWGLLAVFGMAIWWLMMRNDLEEESIDWDLPEPTEEYNDVWKSPIAWQVTIFMGLQSFVYYVTISWVPEIMLGFGFSIVQAGLLVSYSQFVSLPATFLAPVFAEKFANQQGLVLGIGSCMVVGFTGILIGGPALWMIVSITFIGLASGAAISLSLTFLGMRARSAQEARALSGMAQSIGYVLAAIGPLSIGLLFDLTGEWQIPLLLMIGVAILMTIAGLGAGRNKYVGE